jgi:hypothetical protein
MTALMFFFNLKVANAVKISEIYEAQAPVIFLGLTS